MLNITFLLSDKELDKQTKLVITRICELVYKEIDLPKEIQIEFKNLDESTYGETSLNPRYKNRLSLNKNLSLDELVKPLIHELIHIHQIHIGKLSKRRYNFYIWENKTYNLNNTLTYQDYCNLPWELDVKEKEDIIHKKILGR